ncbi:addiction module toxin, HicA family [Rhodoblastus acidophilus]|uniref:Addiction module toxin, HicA family n=2 Tax=Rhodoblastus acidophilus TaxID=1074 RepID=A0A6N8DPQ8_RHOAC|nr:addiction module toxin, HicA family [Rhodoblastus acidophilus]
MKSADLIRELKARGWVLDRIRGSHHVFRHPDHAGHVIRFPKDQFGNRIPLARKSALRPKDFRAISFSRIAKRSCGNRMTVPHPKKDLGRGLVAAIRKQAGLEG